MKKRIISTILVMAFVLSFTLSVSGAGISNTVSIDGMISQTTRWQLNRGYDVISPSWTSTGGIRINGKSGDSDYYLGFWQPDDQQAQIQNGGSHKFALKIDRYSPNGYIALSLRSDIWTGRYWDAGQRYALKITEKVMSVAKINGGAGAETVLDSKANIFTTGKNNLVEIIATNLPGGKVNIIVKINHVVQFNVDDTNGEITNNGRFFVHAQDGNVDFTLSPSTSVDIVSVDKMIAQKDRWQTNKGYNVIPTVWTPEGGLHIQGQAGDSDYSFGFWQPEDSKAVIEDGNVIKTAVQVDRYSPSGGYIALNFRSDLWTGHYWDAGQRYALKLNGTTMALTKIKGAAGSETTLASKNTVFAEGTRHLVEITATNQANGSVLIKVNIDGVKQFEVVDSSNPIRTLGRFFIHAQDGNTDFTLLPSSSAAIFNIEQQIVNMQEGNMFYGVGEPLYTRAYWQQDVDIDDSIALMKEMGVKSFRLWFEITNILLTPTEANMVVVQRYHEIIEKCAKNGISVIGMSNAWFYNGEWLAVPNRNTTPGSAYMSFMGEFKTKWQTMAALFPGVAFWEIANETNGDDFLHPVGFPQNKFTNQQKADITTDLMYYGSLGVHAGNPDALVVMPPPTPCDDLTVGMENNTIANFIEKLYINIKSGAWPSTNTNDFFQILSWHPYNIRSNYQEIAPDNIWIQANHNIYNVAVRYGDGEKPVFLTEFGYSDYGNENTDYQQGIWLTDAMNYAKDLMPYVKIFNAFRLYNDPSSYSWGGDYQVHFGLFNVPDANGRIVPKHKAYGFINASQSNGNINLFN